MIVQGCRLGRSLKHLVSIVDELNNKEIGFKVLAGKGAQIDTTTSNGRLVFGIFAALAEFETDLIRERTKAGLAAARARGRVGGRPRLVTPETLRMTQAAMADPKSNRRIYPAYVTVVILAAFSFHLIEAPCLQRSSHYRLVAEQDAPCP